MQPEESEERPDPSEDLTDPRNDPSTGCGITVKQNDLGNGWGHRWIEIDDPGRGKGGDSDFRPSRTSGLGFYPEGWYSPEKDGDCDTCEDDPATGLPGDTTWDVEIAPDDWVRVDELSISPNAKNDLRHGPHGRRWEERDGEWVRVEGVLPSQASCEQIRECLYSFRPSVYYGGLIVFPTFNVGNCRSVVNDALHECGLRKTNKQRTVGNQGGKDGK